MSEYKGTPADAASLTTVVGEGHRGHTPLRPWMGEGGYKPKAHMPNQRGPTEGLRAS